MKIKRPAAVISLVAAGALTMSACGTDDNTSGSEQQASTANVACEGKESLAASGATSQTNAMTRFINAYESACDGKTLNYNSSGSGAGINDFLGGQTDFAGSDSPLSEEDGEVADAAERCDGNEAWNLPVVFGPIAMTYNLEGVDGVVLDGPTLAKIFSGGITNWNDEEIAKLNEGKQLPDQEITVIFRSDESGTTDNFQKYLETSGGDAWGKGDGKSFAGGVGEGAKGNEGTSAAVKDTPGSITYNEWSYAEQNNLQIAQIINNGGGDPVELTAETAGTAIDAVELEGEGNDLRLNLDSLYGTETEGAYPLVMATYEIVCSKYPNQNVAGAVKSFLGVAISDGQEGLAENGYIPVPEEFQGKLKKAVEAIA
ncbi:phosphate ABC transporter substrate-binding protein (PhoT family) [Tamaricihabitans halophyticus]|uniref:Phosphate-binding protein n=1 Tax=Tamaricihabitans halophyticus TaxID=1262583 RepID=A0A4R2R4R3_9PSEU|nr:phosphate ABC transporter substrate-binding protein PstS [Tamaricihabitans halophyticus]TCP54365.1 phosphate ABC transporter substrate-binding protein (PhoT family) [Tamaricihabitans halophyticus]